MVWRMLPEALSRVIPFAAGKKDDRPVLKCIRFAHKEGKLALASADGYRLAIVTLDFGDGEGEALIPADELKGMISALKRAKRLRLAFEPNGIADHQNLVIETEAIRYKWGSASGTYPDYEKLIPTEAQAEARFDTRAMLRAGMAVASLHQGKPVGATVKVYMGEGQIRLCSSDEGGEATIEAETEGEAKTAINAKYLAQALKALGGMAELKVKGPSDPILFTVDGYQLLVMPMFVKWGDEAEAVAEAEAEAVAEADAVAEAVAEAEPIEAEAHAEEKPKRKRKAKEPVAVGA